MSDGNAFLALTLGTAGGLLLAYLRLADKNVLRTSVVHTPGSAPRPVPNPSATVPVPKPSGTVPKPSGTVPDSLIPAPTRPTSRLCSLRLDAKGLTADGQAVDVPGAVARCKAAGRAELVFAGDGPASVYVELNRALLREGVRVEVSGQ